MKRASFVVLMWLLLVLRSNAFIYLSEPGYYELNGSTATMSVYRIDNDNPFTAPAYLSLWATKEPYYGGSISGFRIAQAYVGELAPYSTEFFVERSGGFRPPPNGKYYITLLVGRWDGSQILANDFLYMGTETFGPKEPIISSATFTNGFLGTPFKYQIRALNGPTGFGAADLPPGLTVSKSTGLISGTPTLAGGFVSTIWATNTGGAGFAELYINIYKKPPVIKSALSSPPWQARP